MVTKRDTCLIPFPSHSLKTYKCMVAGDMGTEKPFPPLLLSFKYLSECHFWCHWYQRLLSQKHSFGKSLVYWKLPSLLCKHEASTPLRVREMQFKQHHSDRIYFWMSFDGYFFPQVRHVAGRELMLALPGFIKVFAYVYESRDVRCFKTWDAATFRSISEVGHYNWGFLVWGLMIKESSVLRLCLSEKETLKSVGVLRFESEWWKGWWEFNTAQIIGKNYESSQRSTCLKSCAFQQEQKQRNGGGEILAKSTGCDKNGNNEHLKANSSKGGE